MSRESRQNEAQRKCTQDTEAKDTHIAPSKQHRPTQTEPKTKTTNPNSSARTAYDSAQLWSTIQKQSSLLRSCQQEETGPIHKEMTKLNWSG